MLQALKQYSKSDAQLVLARVTDLYLPNPGVSEAGSDAPDATSSQVIAELRERIGLPPDDKSSEATTEILSALTEEMSDSVLSGVSISGVKARLSQRGDLPPALYNVHFHKSFDACEELSITKEDVMAILNSPDDIENLLTERFSEHGHELSLFLQDKGDHVILLQATRKGGDLSIDFAWRVYWDSVNLSGPRRPLAVLRAFLDAFGLPLEVGTSIRTKFALHEAYPIPDRLPANWEPVRILDKRDYDLIGSIIFRVSPLHVVEVVIAYVIDADRYAEYLRRHGWNIGRSGKHRTLMQFEEL